MRIFRYKQPDDDGMAPCWHDGLLSLATCKPRIRRKAQVGDWVIGCLPKRHGRGHVVWAGEVTERVPIADYERRFTGRPDAIYRFADDGTVTFLRPGYHPSAEDRQRDLGGPVLLFAAEHSWYFGDRPKTLPDGLIHLAPYSRDYNVAHVRQGDQTRLLRFLTNWQPGAHGKPSHRQCDHGCGGR